MTVALVGFLALLVLVFLRIPIAMAMLLVGFAGFSYLVSFNAAFAMIAGVAHEAGFNYLLSVIPLFVLMGNLVSRAGMAGELYAVAHAFLGHRRGGLAMSTVVACGGFSALCGSSLATAATMAKVALPNMRKFGYSDALATGAIAAGGTLGILIPPSILLVLYGIMTQTSIGQLFAAGMLPGLLGIALYVVAVLVSVAIDPASGPRGEKCGWGERFRCLRGVWAVVLLFVVVIGGIYGGVFTPTEAAGIGAAGAFLIALLRGRVSLKMLGEVFSESIMTSAMIFTILIGTLIFSKFVNLTGMAAEMTGALERAQVGPNLVLIAIICIYLLLGCVLESLSMVLLTVPVFYPLVAGLGFNLIWFGILVVVVTEISLITPPIGMNVFVLKSVVQDIPTRTIFKGVTPFWIADIIRLALLVGFPSISLALPSLLK